VRTSLVADVADVSSSPGDAGRRGISDAAYSGRSYDPADEQLVERIADADGAALGVLYDRYRRPAYSLARRICGDDGMAEEVLQEVFLAVWRDPRRFDPGRGRFVSWLLTLVHHKAVDAVRRESVTRRRTISSSENEDEWSTPPGPGADLAALGSVIAGQVRDALRQLPNEQRRALALAYFGGYTQQEVASITGVPLGTVKSRMFNGVQRLRRLLIPLQWESSVQPLGKSR
jgi:RNA polymerase sigma factor (sigma-70 family)